MRRLTRLLFLGLAVLTIALPASADKAKDLWKQGKDAEARQNYEAAYEFYKQAYDLKPKELWYRTAYERTKFLAAASHVHRGHLLRDAGKLEEALAEFQRATEIDPSSFIAQQEIKRTRLMIDQAKTGPPPQAAVRSQDVLARRMQNAAGPVELAPIANVPITLKLSEDTKVIYETVGKLAGINVLFDPDYTSRRIRIELNGVTLPEALQIIALESKTFWRPVTPNTIFVAADTLQKRKEIEQSVIKTFYLSNLSAQTELTDVVNTLRTILEVSRVQPLPSQGAIVVRGTPDQIALAEKLVGDLDKARPEVIVEVAIMSVSRDKLRQFGINPPTSASVALNGNLQTTTTNVQGNSGAGGTATQSNGTPNTINLNRIGNLQATDFVVTIPQATATALLSDSTTKIIQNPQIRSLDGQKASLKIGQRVPVATGSFQPGIGGVGINPLVNTQFQYLDVGVNIDITPHVHANREVSMKLMLDVSSVVSQTNIGGISQPVIGQRKIEHEIRLKEGEVNLLGGIFDETDTKALSGIPWLAQIPILRYLFSQTNKERVEDEIVFALVPHIVRGTEISEFNEKPLDVGTANAIELHTGGGGGGRPAASASTSGGAQAVPVPVPATTQPAQQPGITPANPPQTQPGSSSQPQAPSGPPTLSFDPATVNPAVGSTFAVNVAMNGAQNIYSVPVQLSYDPKTLQLVNVSNGGLLSSDGQAVALVNRDDPTTGTLQVTATRPPGAGGVSGQGTIFTLTFMAKAPGASTLAITRGGARDPSNQPIQVTMSQASVTVH